MTQCIKTGAFVELANYSAACPADIFAVGEDTLVINFRRNFEECAFRNDSDDYPRPVTHVVSLFGLDSEYYWDKGRGILVIPSLYVRNI